MTPSELLQQLSEAGEGAGADYNDGIDAYFGWDVTEVRNAASGNAIRAELTVTLQRDGEQKIEHTWILQPK